MKEEDNKRKKQAIADATTRQEAEVSCMKLN